MYLLRSGICLEWLDPLSMLNLRETETFCKGSSVIIITVMGNAGFFFVETFVLGECHSLPEAVYIMKTCLYNCDPLKPHFHIGKLRFTGVYIIFLISSQKHRLWVLVRTAVLTSTHNLCFELKYEKYQRVFLSENFQFLEEKFSIYLFP